MNSSATILSVPCKWSTAHGPVHGRQIDLSTDIALISPFLKNLAQSILTDGEQKKYNTLSQGGRRQSEWLLARLAAKELAVGWAQDNINQKLTLREIEIASDEKGKPFFKVPKYQNQWPDLSLSHSGLKVVAVLSPTANQKVGVDWESLETHPIGKWVDRTFGKDELENFDRKNDLVVLGLWAAKEAVGKALGTGLGGDPRNFFVTSFSAHKNEAVVTHKNKDFLINLYPNEKDILALCVIG
ncbi:MAG TPA: hypothetical protein DDW49_01305 [Deltaproteobacteria bacterium]|nr:MAG: hypothetical protein A2048_07530 [Deltaproteobacteria bacterium GWA2_45_12]HBF12020.1 hypothetical protein [Deltaproteobacteria bacterium]